MDDSFDIGDWSDSGAGEVKPSMAVESTVAIAESASVDGDACADGDSYVTCDLWLLLLIIMTAAPVIPTTWSL